MAHRVDDRVAQISTTTGTSDFSFISTVVGFKAFSAIASIADSDTTWYFAENVEVPSEWEIGLGTYRTSGAPLRRTTVLKSSNSDAKVSFSAGAKRVMCGLPSAMFGRPTWTPQLQFGGAATGMSGTFTGFITKLDNRYVLDFDITLTAKGSSTGSATMPVPAGISAEAQFAGTAHGANMASLGGPLLLTVNSSNAILIRTQGASSLVNVTDANFTDTSRIIGQMTIRV